MMKRSLFRGLISYCISVTVTLIVYLVVVLCGVQNLCVPFFVDRVGNELAAILIQTLLIGLIAFGFGASSVFFEIERWSLLKQGAAHLAVTASVWFIVHLICFSPFTPPVVISFAASAFASYAITWSVQYFVWRAQVRKLNEQILQKNEVTHP